MPFDGVGVRETKDSLMLLQAKTLLLDPDHWTKGRLRKGFFPRKRCMVGALQRAQFGRDHWLIPEAGITGRHYFYPSLVKRGYTGGIEQFNDARKTTHADVMVVFDEAIARARQHA